MPVEDKKQIYSGKISICSIEVCNLQPELFLNHDYIYPAILSKNAAIHADVLRLSLYKISRQNMTSLCNQDDGFTANNDSCFLF